MTAPPPPDSHPTGPPSGPLSGPSSGAPSGPSHEPTQVGQDRPEEPTTPGYPGGPGGPGEGGGYGGGGGEGGGGYGGRPGGGRPWWRSAPRVAIISAAVVAAVVLTIILTRPNGETGAGEVKLQAAAADGDDPFTKSTADESPGATSPKATPSATSAPGKAPSVSGGQPGLYGGSMNAASCDVEQQIDYLQHYPEKADAFAGVLGKKGNQLPSYLRQLTPVQLQRDTWVTNHGYKDGKATTFQSVLQTGTAVMIDAYGVPRVRCACGNPLTPPESFGATPKTTGQKWPGYQSSNVVTVRKSATEMDSFTLVDTETGQWFQRPRGDTGESDYRTNRPAETPSETPSATTESPTTPAPSPSATTSEPTTPPAEPSTPHTPPSPAPDSSAY
ncbi:DUF6777 domain-containing protein [Streptomyces piniterrae]|uniref:DUF6777 domain-containing protein n=1 Tax=Streptomyces piniterrae TaxID=2571125 RepID=UPI00145EFC8D|nr:DUF6777 domain-containing protein [Streptomyces piniterrae]